MTRMFVINSCSLNSKKLTELLNVFLNKYLDFVLSYARRGELLDYLHKLSSFDEDCSKHYTAEIVKALDYLHGVDIVHRYVYLFDRN